MWPVLYDPPGDGPSVNAYGLLVLSAFVAGFILAFVRSRRVGIDVDRLMPVLGAATVGGLLGARVLYLVAVSGAEVLRDPSVALSCSGFAFYGGLLGGLLGVLLAGRFLDVPAFKLLDVLAPALALGLGVGRLGCFFAGCCHGAPVQLTDAAHALLPAGALHGQIWLDRAFPFFALEFARDSGGVARLVDQTLYPTQLWSAAAGIGVAALLVALTRFRRFDGMLVGLFFVIEPPLRFFIEGFRGDHRGYAFTWSVSESVAGWFPGMAAAGGRVVAGADGLVEVGLTTSQGLAALMIAAGVMILVLRRNAGVAPETPIVDPED
jgi:phosphatidylglycerol:prolipoprotein diacylglycerol transferase